MSFKIKNNIGKKITAIILAVSMVLGVIPSPISNILDVQAQVSTEQAQGVNIVQFSTSNDTTYAVDENYHLWSWGKNDQKQLGRTNSDSKVSGYKADNNVAGRVTTLDSNGSILNKKIVKVSAASDLVAALDADGKILLQGKNSQHGSPSKRRFYYPGSDVIGSMKKVVDVEVSENAVFTIDVNGDVWIYSYSGSENYETGTGAQEEKIRVFRRLDKFGNDNIVKIDVSEGYIVNSVMALTEKGEVYVWGANTNGFEKDPSTGIYGPINGGSQTPRKIENVKAIDVATSAGAFAYIDKDGQLYAWGGNGKSAAGFSGKVLTPRKVEGMKDLKSIKGGYGSLVATDKNGKIFVSGNGGQYFNSGKNNKFKEMEWNNLKTVNTDKSKFIVGSPGKNGIAFLSAEGNIYVESNNQEYWGGGLNKDANGNTLPMVFSGPTVPYITELSSTPAQNEKTYTSIENTLNVTTNTKVDSIKYVITQPDNGKYYEKNFAELADGHYLAGSNRSVTMSPHYGEPETVNYANPKITKAIFDEAYTALDGKLKGEFKNATEGNDKEYKAVLEPNTVENGSIVWIQVENSNGTNRMVFEYNNVYTQSKAWVEATAVAKYDGNSKIILQEPTLVEDSYGIYFDESGNFVNNPTLGYDLLQPNAPKVEYWELESKDENFDYLNKNSDDQTKVETTDADGDGYLNRIDKTNEIMLDSLKKKGDELTKTPLVNFKYVKDPNFWAKVNIKYVNSVGTEVKVKEGASGEKTDDVIELFAPTGKPYKVGQDSFTPPKAVNEAQLAIGYKINILPTGEDDKGIVKIASSWKDEFDPTLNKDDTLYIIYNGGFIPFNETFIDVTDSENRVNIKNNNDKEVVVKSIAPGGEYSSTAPEIKGYVAVGHEIVTIDGDESSQTNPDIKDTYKWNSTDAGYIVEKISVNPAKYSSNIKFLYKKDINENGIPDDEEGEIKVAWIGVNKLNGKSVLFNKTFFGNKSKGDKLTVSEDKANNITNPTDWLFRAGTNNDVAPYLPKGSDGEEKGILYLTPMTKDEFDIYFYYDQDYNSNGVADKDEGKININYKLYNGKDEQGDYKEFTDLDPAEESTNEQYLEGTGYYKDVPIISNYVAVGYELDSEVTIVDKSNYNNFVALTTVAASGHTLTYLYKKDINENSIPDDEEGKAEVYWYIRTAAGSNLEVNRETIVDFAGETKTISESDYEMGDGYLFVESKNDESITISGEFDENGNIIAGGKYKVTLEQGKTKKFYFYYDEDANKNGIPDKNEPIVITISGMVVDENGKKVEGAGSLYTYSMNSGYSNLPFEIKNIVSPTYIVKDGDQFAPVIETAEGSKDAITVKKDDNGIIIVDPSKIDVNSQEGRKVNIIFKHVSNMGEVTVRALYKDTETLIGGIQKVTGEIDKELIVKAPVLEGFTLVTDKSQLEDGSKKVIVAADGSVVVDFYYTKNKGNLKINAVDTDGNIIGSKDVTVDKGGKFVASDDNAPSADDISDLSNFKLVPQELDENGKPYEYPFDGVTPLDDITYVYERITREVEVRAFYKDVDGKEVDIRDEDQKGNISRGKLGVGLQHIIVAPTTGEISALTTYTNLTGTYKTVTVENVEGTLVVSFEYEKIPRDSYKVIAYNDANGNGKFDANTGNKKLASEEEIFEYLVYGETDREVGTIAPEIAGYTLTDTKEKFEYVGEGRVVYFAYRENNVKISFKLKDTEGKDLISLIDDPSYSVPSGLPHTAYAPHIPGYVIADGTPHSVKINNVTEDKVIEFTYVPISEVVDLYTSTINVKGIVKNSSPEKVLYSYSYTKPNNSGKEKLKAMVQEGYDLVGEKEKTINVGTEDIDVTFEYTSRDATVTIYTYEGSESASDNVQIGSPFTVNVQLDDDFTYRPPYIPGYYTTDEQKSISPIENKKNTMNFYYQKAEGNLTLLLKENDATGAVISSQSVTLNVSDKNKVIMPPELKDLYYTAIKNQSATVSYSDTEQVVEFYYTKDMKTVKTIGYDITNGKTVSKPKLYETEKSYRLGELATFSAKSQEGLSVVGQTNREVLVIPETKDQVFEYENLGKDKIEVIAQLVDEKGVFVKNIQTTVINNVKVGESIDITAPELVGYALKDSTAKTKTVKAGENAVFEYVKNVRYVTIEAREKTSTGKLLNNPAPKYEVAAGQDYLAHAPHVPGYVLVNTNNMSKQITGIVDDMTVIFEYRHITEVVSDFTANVTVKGVVQGTTTELYNYTYTEINNAGDKTVDALSQDGYKIVGYSVDGGDIVKDLSKAPITVKENDITVVFYYKSLATSVKINLVDSKGNELAESFHVAAEIGKPFEYRAPFVDGYNATKSIITIDKITSADTEITFTYLKAQGNVTVELYEVHVNGNEELLKKVSYELAPGESKTIEAPSLTADYYVVKDGTSTEEKVSYSEEPQTIKFYYTKELKTVKVVAYDVTNSETGVLIEDSTVVIDDARLGEIRTFDAKVIEKMKVFGLPTRDVLVTKDLNEVRFEYTSTEQNTVNIIAAYANGSTIQTVSTLRVPKGSEVTVNRPILLGYKGVPFTTDEDGNIVEVDEVPSSIVAKAGENATFFYEKDEVVINIIAKVRDKNGVEITNLIDTNRTNISFNVARTAQFTAYAPHIPGYLLTEGSARKVDIASAVKNQTVEFYYETINDAIVNVKVNGVDADTGRTLFSYTKSYAKNTGKVKVDGFRLSGYEVEDDIYKKEVNVGEKDLDVNFKYKGLTRTITVKAVDADTMDSIPGFTDILVPAQIGQPFSYNAPYIPGYELKDTSTIKTIDKVTDNHTISFTYVRSEGNVVFIAKEDNENGRVIKSASQTLTEGTHTINPEEVFKDLSKDFYTLISGSKTIDFALSENVLEVEFYYSKDKRYIDIKALDEDGNEIKSALVEKQGPYRIGEVTEVVARHINGYILNENATKMVSIVKGKNNNDNQVVEFNYRKMADDELVVIAKYGELILQSNIIVGEKGSKVSVNAPVIAGYKLKDGESSLKSGIVGETTIVFDYIKNVINVNLELVALDENGKETKLDAPAGVKDIYIAPKGVKHIAYAPHIPGYTLISNQQVEFEKELTNSDVTARFEYKETKLEDIGFFINVQYVNKTDDVILSQYSDFVPYNAEAKELKYYAIPFAGFTLTSEEEVTIPNDGAIRKVVFEYEKTALADILVTLYKSSSTTAATSFETIEYLNRLVGSVFEYKVSDLSKFGLDFVESKVNGVVNDSEVVTHTVDAKNNKIDIYYKNANRNVTINRILKASQGEVEEINTSGSSIVVTTGAAIRVTEEIISTETVSKEIGSIYKAATDFTEYVYVGGNNSIKVNIDENLNVINLYYLSLDDLQSREVIVNHYAKTPDSAGGDSWLISTESIKNKLNNNVVRYNTKNSDKVKEITEMGYEINNDEEYVIDLLNATAEERIINIYYTPKTISYNVEYHYGDNVVTEEVAGAYVGTAVETPKLNHYNGYSVSEIIYSNSYLTYANNNEVVVTVKYKENDLRDVTIRYFDVKNKLEDGTYFLIKETKGDFAQPIGSEFIFSPYVNSEYIAFEKNNSEGELIKYKLINNNEQSIYISENADDNVINLYYNGELLEQEKAKADITINSEDENGNLLKTETNKNYYVGERFVLDTASGGYSSIVFENKTYNLKESSKGLYIITALADENDITLVYVEEGPETVVPDPVNPGGGGSGGGNSGGGSGDGGDSNQEPELVNLMIDGVPFGTITNHFRYIYGYKNGMFKPNDNATRAEIAQVLYNIYKEQNPEISGETESQFSDVDSNAWYAEAVNYLASIGVINGYRNGTYKPNQPISREEYVTLLVLFSGKDVVGENSFSDVNDSGWASKYISTAYSNGFIKGYRDGTFRGENNITRGEIVVSTNRMLGRVIDETAISEDYPLEATFSDVNSDQWFYLDVMEASNNHMFELLEEKEVWTTAEEMAEKSAAAAEAALEAAKTN
ncbi:MAG: S-layer homology domain-containing protein [Lachnospirales bacterium]